MSSDARLLAASIIQRIRQDPSKASFCCYGTPASILIGFGRESSLNLIDTQTLDAVWAGINEYIEANVNQYILGFIGFDPANQLNRRVVDYQQKIDLFVPKTVIECKGSDYKILKGKLDIDDIIRQPLPFNYKPINTSELDQPELRNQYATSVARIIQEIQAGTIERATLARRINSPRPFDLIGTFLSDQSQHELSHSFYFSNQYLSFAGQCPELLAEGNTRLFATHKLSGTYAKSGNIPTAELASRFLADHRIIVEHQSAISAIDSSLSNLGTVQCTKFKVMELPTLLHGWSHFVTRPENSVTVVDCLRSIFPFGVNPLEKGLGLLKQNEDFSRGPYYGLAGCIVPGGEFSFTQVLRSAFIDSESSHLLSGAAITQNSTPELEVNETSTKLSGIRIFERTFY